MKNKLPSVFLCLTVLFVCFLSGFYLGRNSCSEAVMVRVPEQMLTVPPPARETEAEICFPIDLNTADKEEIMALPGIGETLTLRILAYRRERARFFSVEELMQVEGITQNLFEEIRELVYVGG